MQITARDLVFDVVAGGPPDGPAVLLLHGFPQHAGEWELVTARLHDAGARTYALDQRGYSPGARPTAVAAYTVDECVADAIAVLDALGVDRAHVVGHDWGSVVAWHLAAGHPDRFATLTAISVPHPTAFAAALAGDGDQRERSSYIAVFQQEGTAEDLLLADDGHRLRDLFTGVPPERVERYVTPMLDRARLTGGLNWYRALGQRGMSAGPVSLPTTFLWSDGDVAIGAEAAQNCAAYVTGDYRFVTLSGVSHWIPDEAPDTVADEILARMATAPVNPEAGTVFVKICGLSTEETVATAVDAGADAVGFVLTRSPRLVTPQTARHLAAAVPPRVLTVAVVAGTPIDQVRSLVQACGLRALQLHGDYTRADFAAVADLGLTLIRAVSYEAPDLRIGAYGEDLLLVDATEPGSGGAWDYAMLRGRELGAGWILAGGLGPATVAEAVALSGAGGVDVSSGVESARGVKNDSLIREFVAAARQAG